MAEGNWGSAGMHKVDIRNDLMFSYVMRNPEICTELLEVLCEIVTVSQDLLLIKSSTFSLCD